MSVEYAEIEKSEHIKECVVLQKKIFDLSDIDVIPEMFLKMIVRKDPLLGILVGVFKKENEKEELIGIHISISANEDNSVYSLITGVLPEYQNKMYGYGLILKARELVINNGVKTVYTIYDPLESNLGRLYMQRFGFKGIRFKDNAYELNSVFPGNEIPNDKILVKWDILCDETIRKIEGTFNQISLIEALKIYPIATENDLIDSKYVLVEIPNDFKLMKEKDPGKALEWRKRIKIIFAEYINNRKYVMMDCLSARIEKVRKTYYLLEKL